MASLAVEPSADILAVDDLTVTYLNRGRRFTALDSLSLRLRQGEILGLVGESGSGKTTAASAILGLIKPPGQVESGRVVLDGVDLRTLDDRSLRRLRWQSIALVPQGSMNALNPVLRIEDQFADVMRAHGAGGRSTIRARIAERLESVGLPQRVARMYPHELSGGMKQRACIAMAVVLEPRVIVADEPTSALDVVVQRSVMETLKGVQQQLGMAMILIGHDMGLQAQVVDRLGVMCRGRLVEVGPVDAVFRDPSHPYTRLLLEAVPSIRQASWTPVAAAQELRKAASSLVDEGHPLRPVGVDHEAALP